MVFLRKVLFISFIVLYTGGFGFSQSEKKESEEQQKEFVVAFSDTDIGFDPLHTYTATEAQFYSAIYEGLVVYDPFSLLPRLGTASRWEISEDKKTYRFYLRSDARYWDGTKVTARHFRDSWMRLLDPEEKAEYSFLLDIVQGAREYRTGISDDPDSVAIRAVSESILEVTLTHPAGHFLKILCHHSFVPVHPDLMDVEEWSSLPSIPGNGPFYIVNKTDSEIKLVKNNLYWDARNVELDSIRAVFSDDVEDITSRFNGGEIHWIVSGVLIEALQDPRTIVTNPMFATGYFFFKSSDEPYSDSRVRRGLSLLLPWEEIRSTQFMFIPTDTLVPQVPSYPEVEGIGSQDSDEGFSLLEEAGFPRGEGLGTIVIKIPPDFESRRITGIMKETWEQYLDTAVEIREYNYPDYYSQLQNSEYTLGTITWIGDFADPLTFLQMWTKDSNLNDGGYYSEEFEAILDESTAQEGAARYETLGEAERVLLKDAAVLPINHEPAWNIIDLSLISGWYPNPLDIHPFKFVGFAAQRLPPGVVLAYPPLTEKSF